MLKKWAVGLALLMGILAAAPAWAGDTFVRGYTHRNGTYVAPHYRSAPDEIRSNNWSCCGNTNPYTGKIGSGNGYRTFGSGNGYRTFGNTFGNRTYRIR